MSHALDALTNRALTGQRAERTSTIPFAQAMPAGKLFDVNGPPRAEALLKVPV